MLLNNFSALVDYFYDDDNTNPNPIIANKAAFFQQGV